MRSRARLARSAGSPPATLARRITMSRFQNLRVASWLEVLSAPCWSRWVAGQRQSRAVPRRRSAVGRRKWNENAARLAAIHGGLARQAPKAQSNQNLSLPVCAFAVALRKGNCRFEVRWCLAWRWRVPRPTLSRAENLTAGTLPSTAVKAGFPPTTWCSKAPSWARAPAVFTGKTSRASSSRRWACRPKSIKGTPQETDF